MSARDMRSTHAPHDVIVEVYKHANPAVRARLHVLTKDTLTNHRTPQVRRGYLRGTGRHQRDWNELPKKLHNLMLRLMKYNEQSAGRVAEMARRVRGMQALYPYGVCREHEVDELLRAARELVQSFPFRNAPASRAVAKRRQNAKVSQRLWYSDAEPRQAKARNRRLRRRAQRRAQ
jgi:hypothetical protein